MLKANFFGSVKTWHKNNSNYQIKTFSIQFYFWKKAESGYLTSAMSKSVELAGFQNRTIINVQFQAKTINTLIGCFVSSKFMFGQMDEKHQKLVSIVSSIVNPFRPNDQIDH